MALGPCGFEPRSRHSEVVETIDQQRQSPFVAQGAWADPTLREFREYRLRCARCGEETWRRHTEAPAWGRYMR